LRKVHTTTQLMIAIDPMITPIIMAALLLSDIASLDAVSEGLTLPPGNDGVEIDTDNVEELPVVALTTCPLVIVCWVG